MAWSSVRAAAVDTVSRRRRRRKVRLRPQTIDVVPTKVFNADTVTRPKRRRVKRRRRPYADDGATYMRTFYSGARGLFRVFNGAEYRFYRSSKRPPVLTDLPYATSPTVPNEPPDLFADGTWYISMSHFNGVLDSGFLPIGTAGETYVRVDIAGGVTVNPPPRGPNEFRLEVLAARVVRIHATYVETGAFRATDWLLGFAVGNASVADPPVDPSLGSQEVTVTPITANFMPFVGDIVTQSDGQTVKVRLQTVRQEPAVFYSENSIVLSAVAKDTGGGLSPVTADPYSGTVYPGRRRN